MSPLLAFSTLFSRLADSFPLNRIHRNHIGRLIFNGPPKCLKLVLLFIFSLSLFFPPLSLRAEQNAICLTLLASLDDAFAPVMDLQGRDFVSPVPFQ